MEDRILHEVAKLLLTQLGAHAVRIHDHAVEAKTAAGTFRIPVQRL